MRRREFLTGAAALAGLTSQAEALGLGKLGAGRSLGVLGRAGTTPALPVNFFVSDVSSWAFEQQATAPSSIYVASTNTTWQTYAAYNGVSQEIHVLTYNHTTTAWSGPWMAGDVMMAADDHGLPALCRDADGYLWCFYGPHGQSMQYSRSKNPDDPTAWLPQNNIADIPGTYTYAHPTFVGGKIYLFMRQFVTASNNYPLVVRIGTVTAGTISWAAEVQLLNWAGSRCYQGNHILIGTDIHFTMTQADTPDTKRTDVFYFIYETTTGNLRNFAGTTSVAPASQPYSLANSQTNFRIVDQTSVTHEGNIPVWCLNSTTGFPEIAYMDGPTGGPYSLFHTTWNGSAWVFSTVGTFATGGTYNHRYDGHTIVQLPSGGIRAVWPGASAVDRGGSLYSRDRDGAGTWGSINTALQAQGALPLDAPTAVRDGIAGYQFAVTETTQFSSTMQAGVKAYAYADSGPLLKVPATARQYAMATEHLFNRMTVAPSTARAALYDALIRGLMTDGVWDSIDCLHLHKCHDRQAGRLNIRKGNWELAETDSANLTFVTDGYFQGNGTSSFLSSANAVPLTLFNQNVDTANARIMRYILNSAHIWGWLGGVGNSTASFGFTETGAAHSFVFPNGTNVASRLNGGSLTDVNSTTSGFFGVSRTGSTQTIRNISGTQLGPTASATAALVNNPWKVCAHNTSFSTSPVLATGFGGGISAAQMAAIRSRVNAYLTAF